MQLKTILNYGTLICIISLSILTLHHINKNTTKIKTSTIHNYPHQSTTVLLNTEANIYHSNSSQGHFTLASLDTDAAVHYTAGQTPAIVHMRANAVLLHVNYSEQLVLVVLSSYTDIGTLTGERLPKSVRLCSETDVSNTSGLHRLTSALSGKETSVQYIANGDQPTFVRLNTTTDNRNTANRRRNSLFQADIENNARFTENRRQITSVLLNTSSDFRDRFSEHKITIVHTDTASDVRNTSSGRRYTTVHLKTTTVVHFAASVHRPATVRLYTKTDVRYAASGHEPTIVHTDTKIDSSVSERVLTSNQTSKLTPILAQSARLPKQKMSFLEPSQNFTYLSNTCSVPLKDLPGWTATQRRCNYQTDKDFQNNLGDINCNTWLYNNTATSPLHPPVDLKASEMSLFNDPHNSFQNSSPYTYHTLDISGFSGNVLSNERLHNNTTNSPLVLRLDFEATNGSQHYTIHNSFQFENPETDYTLNISAFSGNVEDSLNYQSNCASTKDSREDANCHVLVGKNYDTTAVFIYILVFIASFIYICILVLYTVE